MSKYYNIACLFILFPILANSQTGNHKFEHFSVEQGLSQSTILCIVQDSRGFIWLGTTDGLNKYDGYNFIIYKHDPNDSLSLSANRIYSICEDSSGYLWVGTYGGGLNRFDWKTEQFTHYKNNPDNPASLSDNEILSIYEDNLGVLWIGTDGGGLNKLIPSERYKSSPVFIHYKNNPDDLTSLSSNRIYSIYEDNSGVLWIGTMGGGLNKFDKELENFTHYTNEPDDPSSLSANGVYSIYEDNSGTLWIGTDKGGINKLVKGDKEESSQAFIHYENIPDNPTSLSANRVYSIYEDKSGDLWIGTVGGGLNKFDREKEQFLHYRHDAGNVSSLSSDGVFSIYEDITGVLWIGTYDGGLNKFDRDKE
jgi:two-component system sensor histidine kinase ChiS